MKRSETKYTPNNIPLRILYQCYFFGIGLTLLILAIIAWALITDKLEDYRYIISNWRKDVLIDVQITHGECPNEWEVLNYYNWPGTKDGCDCRDSRRILKYSSTGNSKKFVPRKIMYDDHACNDTQKDYGCVTINSQPAHEMKKWQLYEDILTVCGLRLKGYNWISKAPLGNSCSDNEKMCGNDPDTFFCVPSDSSCPILHIFIDKTTREISFTKVEEENQKQPLVEFRISEDAVCMKNNITKLTSGRDEYPLMQKKKDSCPADSRFLKINQIDEMTFFRINQLDYLPDLLRGFILSDQYKWGFFERGIIFWKNQCRGKTMEKFSNQEDNLEFIRNCQLGLLIVSVFYFTIISCLISLIIFLNIFGYDWPCIKGKGTEESNYVFRIEAILKVVIHLAHCIVLIVAFSTVQLEINLFNDIIDKQCTDPVTMETLKDIKQVIQVNIYEYNLGQLILFIISTLIDCMVLAKLVLTRKTNIIIEIQDIQNQNQQVNNQVIFVILIISFKAPAIEKNYPYSVAENKEQEMNNYNNPSQFGIQQPPPDYSYQQPNQEGYQQPYPQQPYPQQPYPQQPYSQQP